jgi:hypothetical protein
MNIRAFTINKLIQYIILLAILLTPLFSFYEVLALLTSTVTSQTEALTPIYIKVMKDVFFALIIMLSIYKILRRMRANRHIIIFLFLAGIIICNVCLTLINGGNYLLVLAGLRWSIPMFLPFFLIGTIDTKFMNKITKVLLPLFVLHFILQIYQLFNMQLWFGTNVFGLAARTPGIFMIPNTAAFFTVLCWFFFYYYGEYTERQKIFFHIGAGISIFLTMSGTGIVVYALLLCILALGRRYLKIVLPFFPIVVVLLLLLVTLVVGRGEDYVQISGGTRVQIFIDELMNANLLTNSFGIGTNTGVLLAESEMNVRGGKIVDSTYASLVANLGLVGLVLVTVSVILWLFSALRANRRDIYSFTIIFGLFGATTIIFEAFPMSLLFAVCFAHYLQSIVAL